MSAVSDIVDLYNRKPQTYSSYDRGVFADFIQYLNLGQIRSAEPYPEAPTGWRVNEYVKKGILVGFWMGKIIDMSIDRGKQPFFDKHTYPVRHFDADQTNVRIVPGGSSIRNGCYIGKGVTCMPPMYINVGAWVDDGTMIDSHALVGSCAQVGKNCHISAAAQLGGVIEPIGAMPVIIEDNVFVGGNCGVYEGTVVKKGAVLGSGVILTRAVKVFDLTRRQVITATEDSPLVIPENAVVIPGSRGLDLTDTHTQIWADALGLRVLAAIIVKYRDGKTDRGTELEASVR